MKKTVAALLITCLSLTYFNGFSNCLPLADSAKVKFDEGSKFKLTINGQTYDLISYNFNYIVADKRNVNSNPNQFVASSLLNLVIRTSKIDQKLLDWVLNPQQDEKDAKIIVYDSDSGKEIKTITFSGLTTASFGDNGTNQVNYVISTQQQTNFAFRYKTVSVMLNK